MSASCKFCNPALQTKIMDCSRITCMLVSGPNSQLTSVPSSEINNLVLLVKLIHVLRVWSLFDCEKIIVFIGFFPKL